MTKTEAKKLLNDFLDIINGFKSNVESVHISNYLDDPNRTIKFDDDKLAPLKYKVGDKVRIISNSNGNKFEIGEIVTITQLYEDEKHYKANNTTDFWWVGDSVLESIGVLEKEN
jgi:hypothetical protein